MTHILIAEDDSQISEMLQTILQADYDLTLAYSGTEALLRLKNERFDLVLLDLMLPGKTGQEVVSEIRQTSNIPIIVLTAVTDKKVTTDLLLAGANDYLTKPFDIDELCARIKVQLRGQQMSQKESYKNVALLPDSFALEVYGETLTVSKKEYEIFSLLLSHPKKVYTKEMLYEKIWQERYYGDENTVNVHISNLRKKLKAADPTEDYIETVWGIGIKLAQ